MAWTTPKTNWVDGDYFNLDPDYNRIKGNIEYLVILGRELYPQMTRGELESAEINGFPTESFFNKVVETTREMLKHCHYLRGGSSMRGYSSNGVVWNANELNAIENNHLRMYNAFRAQESVIPRLELTLGGVKIGSQALR